MHEIHWTSAYMHLIFMYADAYLGLFLTLGPHIHWWLESQVSQFHLLSQLRAASWSSNAKLQLFNCRLNHDAFREAVDMIRTQI